MDLEKHFLVLGVLGRDRHCNLFIRQPLRKLSHHVCKRTLQICWIWHFWMSPNHIFSCILYFDISWFQNCGSWKVGYPESNEFPLALLFNMLLCFCHVQHFVCSDHTSGKAPPFLGCFYDPSHLSKCVSSLPAMRVQVSKKLKELKDKCLILKTQRDRLMGTAECLSVWHVNTCPWSGRAFPNFDVEMKRWQSLEAFQTLRKHILPSLNPSSSTALEESFGNIM